MARKKAIPDSVREEVLSKVEAYNKANNTNYVITFRSKFAYLSKIEKDKMSDVRNFFMQQLAKKAGIKIPEDAIPQNQGQEIETKIGRLEFNGQMDNWDFAVFRYSREIYDADEFMFPGAGKLNGTIEGALKAGLEIYP